MGKLVIIGYSGHSYVVIDAAHKFGLEVKAYTEKEKRSRDPFKLEYLGFEGNENFEGWDNEHEFILGIGDNKIRKSIAELLASKNENIRSVIHPSANVGSFVEINDGTFVGSGAMINPLVKIGKAVIINTGAIVEHGCQLGDYAHIAPGAVLAGNVRVGDCTFIGANAVVKQGIKIGNDVIVGAGSVVLNNIKSGSIVVGNPARLI